MPKHSELFKRVYSHSSGQHSGRVEICIAGVVALPTAKIGLGLAVRFVGVATLRTLPATVTRIDKADRHARQTRLVFDKPPQLSEGPIAQAASLSSSSRCLNTGSDIGQVFQRQTHIKCLCRSDKSFADVVIRPGLKSALPTREFFQPTPCTSGSASLELLTGFRMTLPTAFNLLSRESLPFRRDSQADYAQIHTQVAFNLLSRRFLNRAGSQQIELSPDQDQITFPVLILQQCQLLSASLKRDRLPSFQGPKRDYLLGDVPLQDATVVSNGTMWPEGTLRLFVQLIGIGYLRLNANRHLRSQQKALSDLPIDQPVQAELTKRLGLPGDVCRVIARCVRPFKGFYQRLSLRRSRNQFHFRRQSHTTSIAISSLEYKTEGDPPRSEDRGGRDCATP